MPDLDIKKHISEIYANYDESGANNIGAMIGGLPLVGKTTMLGTAPGPVAIYSFDPKGLVVLRDEIKSGRVLPFTHWDDDIKKPHAWREFDREVEDHINNGLFKHLGSVAIDSATTFVEACINQVVVNDGPTGYDKKPRLNNIPFIGDYRVIYNKIIDVLKRLATQDVNVFMTVHLEPEYNDDGGIIGYNLMVPGKLKGLLAGLFTETWILTTEGRSEDKKPKRVLLTDPYGMYKVAGSQLSKHGLLELKEEPDIGKLMKKAGVDWKEKPALR